MNFLDLVATGPAKAVTKVLTLTQPWASLVAIGAKRIETRSWSTSYRGPLAIHAAQGLGPVKGVWGLRSLVGNEPFFSALADITEHTADVSLVDAIVGALPRGEIIAVCDLLGCEVISYGWPSNQQIAYDGKWGRAHYPYRLTDQERAFGDYSVGRYVWLLDNVRALPKPIPTKGSLGLWNYDGVLF